MRTAFFVDAGQVFDADRNFDPALMKFACRPV